MKVTIYQKPACSTCREVYAALLKAGVDVRAVNYYTEPLPAKKIKSLLKKMDCTAGEILRKRESAYTELGLAEKELSDDELIALMVRHPDLLQRPIVEAGDRAILARPASRIIAFLSGI